MSTIVQPSEEPVEHHAYRSRAGDFFFAGVAGAIALVGAVMLSDLPLLGGVGLGAIYGGALLLRYATLREAAPVAPGVTFNEEEARKYERVRLLLDALPQPVMLLDPQDRVEMSNKACRTVLGLAVDGKHISSVIRAPAALDALRLTRHEEAAHESEFTSTAHEARHFLFYTAPLAPGALPLTPDKGRVVVMIRDRTAQRRLERMRSDFLANASHELRTPLASLLGFIETIETHAKDDPEAQARFLRIMNTQAQRMLRLVEDLVSLSAIELGATDPPTTTLDLQLAAATVCETMEPVFEKAGQPPPVLAPRGPLHITADRDQIMQVIQNLVDNALKYGGDLPHVNVRTGRGFPPSMEDARRTGDTAPNIAARLGVPVDGVAWVQVEDRGEGISATDMPRLTERFYRTDVERSRTKGGTGLGLAIVKHILQRHRGGIQIESAEGKGTVFTCFFPAAPASSPGVEERTQRA